MPTKDGGDGGPPALYMVEVRARDWPALCAFYGDTLGLPRRMRDEPGRFAMYGAREPYIAVVGRGEVPPGRSRVVLDLVVAELDSLVRALSDRGVRVTSPPAASDEGYRIARIEDPEGNEIHLFEWAEPRGA
jgi:predicted enzyme related to lactoylglutathione lyase